MVQKKVLCLVFDLHQNVSIYSKEGSTRTVYLDRLLVQQRYQNAMLSNLSARESTVIANNVLKLSHERGKRKITLII